MGDFIKNFSQWRLNEADTQPTSISGNDQITTTTGLGALNDTLLLQKACSSWSRMSSDNKKKYLKWSKSKVGQFAFDPNVACQVSAIDAIKNNNDREMLKAIIDLDFL